MALNRASEGEIFFKNQIYDEGISEVSEYDSILESERQYEYRMLKSISPKLADQYRQQKKKDTFKNNVHRSKRKSYGKEN